MRRRTLVEIVAEADALAARFEAGDDFSGEPISIDDFIAQCRERGYTSSTVEHPVAKWESGRNP
jgi:hypothetical protein